MTSVLADLSSVWCTAAAVIGCGQVVRVRWRSRRDAALLATLTAPMIGLMLWSFALGRYAAAPFSPRVVSLSLTCLCLAALLWLPSVVVQREESLALAWERWRWWLAAQGTLCGAGAAVMWHGGADWITGIGREPAVVLSRGGLLVLGGCTVELAAALLLLAVEFRHRFTATPTLVVGAFGVAAGLLWVVGEGLWHGYLTRTGLVSGTTMAGVAALFWMSGMLREVTVVPALAPSRRLVYGAAVVGILFAYVLLAHAAVGWAAALARRAVPGILPAVVFAAVATLFVVGSSRHWRHRLWVAIGRHLFRSKHDYGEVWIRLTELVSAADRATTLLQRTAAFCRDLLCIAEVSVWLADSAGGLQRIAVASADTPDGAAADSAEPVAGLTTHNGGGGAFPTSPRLAAALGASFACPLLVNGRVLGVLAAGSATGSAPLDDEDRRVLRYIAAQVGSALGLYRLGEEIAEAREVRSLDRVSTFVLHDLKNLVAQQSFVLENAKKFASDARFVADALAAFEDSTNRMRTLITRLRARTPGTRSVSRSCDLLAILHDLQAKSNLILRAGCRLHVQLPEVGTCWVPVDRSDLTQVVTNLVVNAAESLPPGGGDVRVAVRAVGASWVLDVRDTGCGIPPSFLRDELFRPFRTTKENGLGIGLYQCKAIIEGGGGTIAVTSREHAGTAVTVALPALSAPQTDAVRKDVQYG